MAVQLAWENVQDTKAGVQIIWTFYVFFKDPCASTVV